MKNIYLCTDNDEGGIEAAERLRDILRAKNYENVLKILPQNKDWNEDLKAHNGADFLPSVPHERKEKYLDLAANLRETKINPNRISADLISIYNSADYLRLAEFSVAASVHFLKISGENFPLDMMKNRLANEYKCYLDKGGISVKSDKLRSAVNAGAERLRSFSQTADELKITARKLFDIADCALRLSVEETLVQRAEQKEKPEEKPSDEPFQVLI